MAPLLIVTALVCWLAVGRGTSEGVTADPNLRQVLETTEACPRCDTIFTMLETDPSGRRMQYIDVVERGEPKSGTTFMYHWAHGALVRTCDFLNQWFGGTSCQITTGRSRGLFHTPEKVAITFDPTLGGNDAKCSCDGVDRVEISITDDDKHSLPVDRRCPWQHPRGLAKREIDCVSADGGPLKSYFDIWLCMEEVACPIRDDRHQFVVMRDPRAAAVSTFFHQEKYPASKLPGSVGGDIYTLDEFTLAIAPVLCQWVALRYLLFTIMAPKSAFFWYDEAFLDAHKWHYEWLAAVGVHLPEPVVGEMADAALREDFVFDTKGKNEHPGVEEEVKTEKVHRPTWKQVLRPETLVELNAIARQWLPPPVLAKMKMVE